MAEYISTFITGFGEVVAKRLPLDLPGAKVISVYDGLIQYRYSGDFNRIKSVVYLNNTFYVMQSFNGAQLTFKKMVSVSIKGKHRFAINNGTYRIRFSKENQFAKADKYLVGAAERYVGGLTKLRIDRLNPSTEIWYIIRSEGVGYFAQLLFKRGTTEKDLNKGELRPEFAYLMCCCANLSADSFVCDPFCGFGSIPKQLGKRFRVSRIVASDIEETKIAKLKRSELKKYRNVELHSMDATDMKVLKDGEFDAVITDPPWGFFEHIDNIDTFYSDMMDELMRILKPNGTLVLLSARKDEFLKCCQNKQLKISKQINTLVNGKKAAVFILYKSK